MRSCAVTNSSVTCVRGIPERIDEYFAAQGVQKDILVVTVASCEDVSVFPTSLLPPDGAVAGDDFIVLTDGFVPASFGIDMSGKAS